MDTRHVKAYAPKARKQFLKAVKNRLEKLGITESEILPCRIEGETARINGTVVTAREGHLRKKIVEHIKNTSYNQVLENAAYTWFNRFAAIRFLEVNSFLSHGRRVLSHPDRSRSFQILEEAIDIDLTYLDKEKVRELKLDGTRDEELYKELILAQCKELSKTMPFLFEMLDDETEILLPENLTSTNSIIHSLVEDIPEEEWYNVEIIGWLYQFYISEKKDEVIGKVVKSEDIPAATQLFTPNWIVKYMVQNSVGRQWMLANPDSCLKDKMDYYIEPDEENDTSNLTVDANLSPENIKVLDPACGSGHILVEAYDILKEIYKEKGYINRDIPELIIKNNLYGLDIDDRASQMAGFAVMTKARKDDRRILSKDIRPNIYSIKESNGLDINDIAASVIGSAGYIEKGDHRPFIFSEGDTVEEIHSSGVSKDDIVNLLLLFQDAKTYGSLISIPSDISNKLSAISRMIEDIKNSTVQWHNHEQADILLPFVNQAQILSAKYDAVIANPPYMGNKGMNAELKTFAKNKFPNSKSDLFAMFMERGLDMTKPDKYMAMVTMQSWMFLSSYEKMRENLITNHSIMTLAHLDNMVMGIAFGTSATIFRKNPPDENTSAVYFKINLDDLDDSRKIKMLNTNTTKRGKGLFKPENRHTAKQDDFKKIPGSPIAYWVSKTFFKKFQEGTPLAKYTVPKQGLATGKNDKFLRYWYEVDLNKISLFNVNKTYLKWYPCNKGGNFRRWYGNNFFIINWQNSGYEIKSFPGSVIRNEKYFFMEGITWSTINSKLAMRYTPKGFIFETKGSMCFEMKKDSLEYSLAILNSKVGEYIIQTISPTMDYHEGYLSKIPIIEKSKSKIKQNVSNLLKISKKDWDSFEISWNFEISPVLQYGYKERFVEKSYNNWYKINVSTIKETKELEEENNQIFLKSYELQCHLTPEVNYKEISLNINPHFRYNSKKTYEEYESLFLSDSIKELISYAIGCMMGRYSLDEKGLIYAHSGNEGFDHNKYQTFPADDDGIIPLTDVDWFDDDATNRFAEFIKTVWGEETLKENLRFIAESLGQKRNETPLDAIRRYMSYEFFKDHVRRYKKRPIYWLFSSGKEKAFEALVYLHRYNEATLARMRSTYVNPLQSKMNAYLEHLNNDIENVESGAKKRKLEKEKEALMKKIKELRTFDEELKHYADMRISIDLDDGVKVNYGKFGNLLADRKNITGEK